MFDSNAALAQAASLSVPSITAIPVAIVSADPLVESALRTRLTSARELALVDEPVRARVLIWDALALEHDEEGMPLLPAAALEPAREPPAVVALLPEGVDPMPLLAMGVRAVLDRDAAGARLRAAILAAELGLVVLDEDPGDALVAGWSPGEALELAAPEPEPARKPHGDLTPREHQVLSLLSDGLSNRVIGERLGISAHTVKFHVDALLDKLDARSRTAAVVEAIRRGVLELA